MVEVDDCNDMDNWKEHCQLLLKVSYGMDYHLFYSFLSFIINQRLNSQTSSFNRYRLGSNHCLFDLKSLKFVFNDFIHDIQDKSLENLICPNNQGHILLDSLDDY